MQKIDFQDLPSTASPLNASNMNQLQTNVENEFNSLFESGIWTPIMLDADVNYTRQEGRYFKIGKLVHINWIITGEIESVSSPAYAFINGVPFEAIMQQAGSLFNYANCFNDNITPRLVRVVNNQIGIQDGSSGGTTISSWESGRGTFYLGGSATYLTND